MVYKYIKTWVPLEGEPSLEPSKPARKRRTVVVKPKPRKDKLDPVVKHTRRKKAMLNYMSRDYVKVVNRNRNRDFYYTKRGLPVPTIVQRYVKKLDRKMGVLYLKKSKQMSKTF